MMAASLTLSILEIILLLFGAVILGITIHFFISSRRSLKATTDEMEKTSLARDEWKLRYFNDMELRDKEVLALKNQLQDAEENTNIYTMEAEEMRRINKRLESELQSQPRLSAIETEQKEKELALLKTKLQEATEKVNSYSADLEQIRRINKQLETEIGAIPKPASADIEQRDKEMLLIKTQLREAIENANVFSREAEEMRRQNQRLQNEIEVLQDALATTPTEAPNPDDYLEQLRQAQNSLIEQNQKINLLLGNIDVIKEKEETQREILRSNEELSAQINDMREQLSEKEKEIINARQKEHLTKEMTSMLDSAYSEFNTLQGKIQKLEAQLTSSKMMGLELEDLREEHTKMAVNYEEQKHKLNILSNENRDLQMQLAEAEDKLKEANFQRQQLQKRAAYLEELNNDLQVVSDANKKLESQLKKVGELESKLNMVSEERDQLMRRQEK
jgi:chromosome segregation ATPase